MEKIKNLWIIFIAVFLFSHVYGIIDINLMPTMYIYEYFKDAYSYRGLSKGAPCGLLLFLIIAYAISDIKEFVKFTIITVFSGAILFYFIFKIIAIDNIYYYLDFCCFILTIAYIRNVFKEKEISKNEYKNKIFNMALLLIFFIFIVPLNLNLGLFLTPNTYDTKIIFIDNFLLIPKAKSNEFLYFFNDFLNEESIFYKVLKLAYDSITHVTFLLIALEVYLSSKNKRFYISTMSFMAYIVPAAIFLYFLYPVIGPKYYGLLLKGISADAHWINHINDNLAGSVYPRNGMPSFHFAIALFLYLNTRFLNLIIRSFYFCFFILTIIATIVLGEHYFIDWIYSPLIVVTAMFLLNEKIEVKYKLKLFLFNISFIGIWYLFLWFGIDFFKTLYGCINCSKFSISMTSFLYAFSIMSIIISVKEYSKYCILIKDLSIGTEDETKNFNIVEILKTFALIVNDKYKAVYFYIFSCLTFYIYQTSFIETLITNLGKSTKYFYALIASSIVGFIFGIFIGNKEDSKINPLVKYFICQLVIAIYIVISPNLLQFIDYIYVNNNIEGFQYIEKLILGTVGLLLPNIFMGIISSIFFKTLINKHENASINIFFIHTFWAAISIVITNYIFIQLIGMHNTFMLATIINFCILFKVYSIAKKDSEINKSFLNYLFNLKNSISLIQFNIPIDIANNIKIWSIIYTFITIVLSIAFAHVLFSILGNNLYLSTNLLFIFLVSLSFSAYLGKYIKKIINEKIIWYLTIILSCIIFIELILLNNLPSYLGTFQNSEVIKDFLQKEFVKFIVIFIGIFFPVTISNLISILLFEKYRGKTKNKSSDSAIIMVAIGVILGLLLSGLILKILGLILMMKVIVAICLLGGLITVLNEGYKKEAIFSVLFFALVFVIPLHLNINIVNGGNGIYFTKIERGNTIDFKEDLDSGITSINILNNIKLLLVNGEIQDINKDAIQSEINIPLMHLPNKDNALIIGYGTGIQSKIISDYGFANQDIVEFNEDLFKLSNTYLNKEINKSNITKYMIDGRSYLKITKNKYDLISIGSQSIGVQNDLSLYSNDFYKITKNNLKENGIFQQLIPLINISNKNLLVILNTVRQQYKYINLYIMNEQGIIVATNDEQKKSYSESKILESKILNIDLMKNSRILSSDETSRLLFNIYGKNSSLFISNDDNRYLEYSLPKDNAIKENGLKNIIEFLLNKKN